MESNQVLGAAVTLLMGVLLVGMGISFWVRSSKPILSRKIKDHGVETTGEIMEVRNKTVHLTKVAYMMNIRYETPSGTQMYKYQRTMTKDRVRHYEQLYGSCFCRGMELPIAYLPEEPDKFMVLHPIEKEEIKRNNILAVSVVAAVVLLPLLFWGISVIFNR